MLMMLALAVAKAARDLGSLRKDNRLMLMMLALARESSAGLGKPEKRQPADADDARLGGPWQLAKAARDLGSLKKTTADADDARLGWPWQLAKAARDLGSLKKTTADADDARLGGSRKQRGTWEA
ncbi:unnamed protein product [Symbiodinium natans]|uniref:Uncharacterized protein n=1 Tax=Symbiodinium natans TaxID=878477 RepID=A0A812LNA5_9DINO|nr:unnamed protein product [Symbiodinium natans]